MKPIKMNYKGKSKEFDTLQEGVEWLNKRFAKETLDESVSMRIPKWVKDEMRERKRRFGIPMSKQVLVRYMGGEK